MTERRRTKTEVSDFEGYQVGEGGELIPIAGQMATERPVKTGRPGRKERRHVTWGLIDYPAMAKLEMTAVTARIFWVIAGAVNKDTGIARMTATEIAAELDMARANVSRAIAELEQRRILLRLGRSRWHINPHVTYRGEAKDWEDFTADEPEPEWSRP